MKPPKTSPIHAGASRAQPGGPGTLSVEQLLSALQRKGIPLPFELGTFLVLQAAEQALVLEATEQGMAAPPLVGIGEVWLREDGEVSVVAERMADSEQAACRALVVMLGEMLVRSAPGVPPMLLELVEHGPSDGEWSLLRLRDDLEASLVPLNRGALKRVLSRLLREVRRESDRAPLAAPDDVDLERDVDALLGLETAPEGGRARSDSGTRPAARGGASGAGAAESEDEAAPAPDEADDDDLEAEVPTLRRSGLDLGAEDERVGKRRPVRPKGKSAADANLDAFEEEGDANRGGSARLGIGLALLAAALVAGYLYAGRDRAREVLGLPEPAAPPPAAPPPAPARNYGELRVTSTPARAQVLLFVGKSPVVVPDLPIGVTHEFIAFDGQLSPARAVVPKDAAFQTENGRPRFELALQLSEADARHRPDDLGATRLTQDVGSPSGASGEVRVITSPPGVRVYQLIGFTPDARVQNLAVDEPLEVLVYLPGHDLSRIEVRPDAWQEQGGARVAELDIALSRKGK